MRAGVSVYGVRLSLKRLTAPAEVKHLINHECPDPNRPQPGTVVLTVRAGRVLLTVKANGALSLYLARGAQSVGLSQQSTLLIP